MEVKENKLVRDHNTTGRPRRDASKGPVIRHSNNKDKQPVKRQCILQLTTATTPYTAPQYYPRKLTPPAQPISPITQHLATAAAAPPEEPPEE